MTTAMTLRGGRVFDPAHGVDGAVRDVHILGGRIVSSLPAEASPRVLDARGLVVMPGGVDVHCHIASGSINRARAMQGEEHAAHVVPARGPLRGGSGTLTPSTFLTGYRYAAMGYTTAIDAAVSPSGARQTHLELDDTPCLDAGFLLLVANHQRVVELLDAGDGDAAVSFIAHLLGRTGALGLKVVNPGGVASWRNDPRKFSVDTIDDKVAGTNVSPRAILELMATAAERLRLPHPPHVHCNRLGLPGNVSTTLDTLAALDGRRVHLTHLQFHAYGSTKRGDFTSAAPRLCDHLNAHPHVTADVGQVMFGPAVTLTGDTPLANLLWRLLGQRHVSVESELEAGCGLMPIEYSDRQFLHGLQWAIGLELMLGCSDPWRMLLSTDHPNGASFLAYPAIIAQLMSKALRDEQLAKLPRRVLRHTHLKDLTREMTLSEVAIVTRSGPANVLGLANKGHLAPGADADVTLYHDRPAQPLEMFTSPRYVIKGGEVIVEDAELRRPVAGARHRAPVAPDDRGRALAEQWFTQQGSYSPRQFGLHEHELAQMRTSEK